MTLADFLLARIAEDETAARTALNAPAYEHYGDTAAEECWRMAKSEGCSADGYRFHRTYDPARVLAECEAKRRIVGERPLPIGQFWDGERNMHHVALKHLAEVYADHPEYREEWRP